MSNHENNGNSQDKERSETNPSNGIIGNIRERVAKLEEQTKDVATKDWVEKVVSQKESSLFRWLLVTLAGAIIALAVALINTFRK